MREIKIIAATSVIMAASTMAVNADHHEGSIFEKADKNGDKVVTHAEMMAQARAGFDKWDKNGDGNIVLGELPKKMPLPEAVKKRRDQVQKRIKERVEKRAKDDKAAKKIKEHMEKRHQKMRHRHQPSRMEFMVRHDRNKDEMISLDEFARRAIHRFKMADLNGDGKITEKEAEKARHHMRRKMRGRMHEKMRHGASHMKAVRERRM